MASFKVIVLEPRLGLTTVVKFNSLDSLSLEEILQTNLETLENLSNTD